MNDVKLRKATFSLDNRALSGYDKSIISGDK